MIAGHFTGRCEAAGIRDRNTVNIRCVFMKFIITVFEIYILYQQQAGSHSNGQSQNIDQCENLCFEDVPYRGFQVVADHSKAGFRYSSQ